MSSQATRLLPEVYRPAGDGGQVERAHGLSAGLGHFAAPVPADYDIFEAHPFSNDDLAANFADAADRAESPEYRETDHPVAVLVGESALMASLRFMPEDAILLLDNSPDMNAYMTRYIEALRSAGNIDEWYEEMGFGEMSDEYPSAVGRILRYVHESQAGYWHRAGHEHPVTSDEAFEEASELARQKQIVPWRADLGSNRDMNRLGRVLRAYDARVTFLNLTNVLPCEDDLDTAEKVAGLLDGLPFAPDAPITLTTEAADERFGGFPFSYPARVFYGLHDLRLNGGITDIDSPQRGPAVNPADSSHIVGQPLPGGFAVRL